MFQKSGICISSRKRVIWVAIIFWKNDLKTINFFDFDWILQVQPRLASIRADSVAGSSTAYNHRSPPADRFWKKRHKPQTRGTARILPGCCRGGRGERRGRRGRTPRVSTGCLGPDFQAMFAYIFVPLRFFRGSNYQHIIKT